VADISFMHFPSTKPAPSFIEDTVNCFSDESSSISTIKGNHHNSDGVLEHIREGLEKIGFEVEKSKKKVDKILRPITFGIDGVPDLKYEVDAYHAKWKVGLEVEAGRGTLGNAIYRNLIQGMVLTGVDHLIVAVAKEYKYKSNGKQHTSKDFEKCIKICSALSSHTRVELPYTITLIGY